MEIEQSESKGLSNERKIDSIYTIISLLIVTVFTSMDRASNSASGYLTHCSIIALFVDQNGS